MDKINQLLQENFGITVDQMDTAEARQALGGYYDRVQSAIQLEDPTIIEFILEEIKVAQGTAGGDGLVNENEVQSIVSDEVQQIFEEAGLSNLISQRGYYVLDEEGNLTQIQVPSPFPDGFASLYNITLQPELVAGLQQDLVRAGVVKPDYFDDEDEFGQKTANALSVVLEYADANIFIDKNSVDHEGYGRDAITSKRINMVKSGIIDPVLVTKSALKNAVSVVSTIISADCVISNIRVNESS